MQTETKKPLWKVLKDQITKGEWKCVSGDELNEFKIATEEMDIAVFLGIDIPDEEADDNAQYTALAVNNLHHLAEALEELLNVDELNSVALFNAQRKANEALNRIS